MHKKEHKNADEYRMCFPLGLSQLLQQTKIKIELLKIFKGLTVLF